MADNIKRLVGIAVSPGVAIGTAYCLHSLPVVPSTPSLDGTVVLAELAALDEAVQTTSRELEALHDKVSHSVGPHDADIFRTHLSIVQDRALTDRVRELIGQRQLSATDALTCVAEEYGQLFAQLQDDYLKERLGDVRDVLRRLIAKTSRTEHRFLTNLAGPAVLVADELLPSDVVHLADEQVIGIVTQGGGRTSHAAILARSYGIPAIAGVSDVFESVENGDTLVVDGRSGNLLVNPGEETLRAYRKVGREFVRLKQALAAEPASGSRTADGQELQLLANIGCAADAAEAKHVGAAGVGLFRTEFFFLTHPTVPTEEEEIAAYRAALVEGPDGPTTIRTLDVGGDKSIPYLTHTHEANPMMGCRSIRLSFEHPHWFSQQIRAVLRAASETQKQVRLLFPMITTWNELQQAHEFIASARRDLDQASMPFGSVEVGMMVEVPAAAVAIEHLLEAVDFISIGSNDLVQYLTASDRDNPKVGHLCQALSPAVLRVLRHVIQACNELQKPVTVCGEMAGSLRALILLLGMGLRSFSMSPAFIPQIRDFAKDIDSVRAETILTEVLLLKTVADIQSVVDAHIKAIRPDLLPLLVA